MDLKVALALAATIVFWASAFAAISSALWSFAPAELTLLRFLVASAGFALVALFRRPRLPARRDLGRILFLALSGVVLYHRALSYGQRTVTAGAAGVLSNTSPVFAAVLGVAVLGERLKPAGWLAIALGFAGAGLIGFGEGGGEIRFDPGAVLALAAAASWGVYFVAQKALLARYGALELVGYVVWTATALMLWALPSLVESLAAAPRVPILIAVYLGLFPTVLAYAAWTYVLARAPVSHAVGFLYLTPVLSFVFAWAWLGEVPSALTLAGAALALTGVVLLGWKGR